MTEMRGRRMRGKFKAQKKGKRNNMMRSDKAAYGNPK